MYSINVNAESISNREYKNEDAKYCSELICSKDIIFEELFRLMQMQNLSPAVNIKMKMQNIAVSEFAAKI